MARSPGQNVDWRPRIERVLAHFATPRDAGAGALGDIERMLALVVAWNEKIDLTAARSEDELVDLMLADAALLAEREALTTARMLDVGSGAGAPGIPLALLLPNVRMTLVEPREKRVAFLRTVIGSLERKDIDVVRSRSNGLADQCADVAISRATLPPNEWLIEGARLATRAVWVLLAGGAPPALAGWRIDRDETYRWPLTGAERRALRFVVEAA